MKNKSLSFGLLNTEKSLEQLKKVLYLFNYKVVKSIRNSKYKILLFKHLKKEKYVIYADVEELNEEFLSEISDYYIEKMKLPKKQSALFIVLGINKYNVLVDDFLNYTLVLPNRFNNQQLVFPIVINNSENKLILGTGFNYLDYDEKIHEDIYFNIQNVIKDFMEHYYKMNSVDINDYIFEIEMDSSNEKSNYKSSVIHKYNINSLFISNQIKDTKIFCLIVLLLCCLVLSFYVNWMVYVIIFVFILLFFLFLSLLVNYLNVKKRVLFCSKIKLENVSEINKKIIMSLEHEGYQKIDNSIYEKEQIRFVITENIDDVYKISDNKIRSNVILIQDRYDSDNFTKTMNDNILLLVLSKENKYVYVHSNTNCYKQKYEAIKVISNIYG